MGFNKKSRIVFLFFLVFTLFFSFQVSASSGQIGINLKTSTDDTYFYTINGSEVQHNNLSGLQGGAINEYFHLTNSEYTELNSEIFDWITSGEQGSLDVNSADYWDSYDVASDLNYKILLKEQNITNENWIEDSQESNLNVNNSDFLDGEDGSYYLDNINNYTKDINFSGTDTVTLTLSREGMSDLTASFTDRYEANTNTEKSAGGIYLYNDTTAIYLNETELNNTIDDRDDNTEYTAGSNLTLSGTTFNWDSTWVENTFIKQSEEGNLNVNSSEYWDNLDTPSDITGLGDSNIGSISWSKLKNYPTGCSSGEAVQVINDTLTCVSITESAVNGSGTQNYVPKWTDTETLGNSVIYQDGNNVGIGTTSPEQALHIESTTSPQVRVA